MGSSSALKRFLSNKNTVTILGTLAIILVIYIGYNTRISAAIEPVTVPYALETIQPRTKITADMIGTMEVPLKLIEGRETVLIESKLIVGRYTNVNTMIPKYSLFYEDAVLERGELPDLAVLDVKEEHVLFNLPVSTESTYGNAMYPNNYFDIYYKSIDDAKKIQYGKLVTNVKILAVKDSSGNNVFENSEDYKTPAMLIFGVPKDLNLLLRKALYLKDYNAELVPVPIRQVESSKKLLPKLASNYLASFINAKTINVPDDELPVTNTVATTEATTTEDTE